MAVSGLALPLGPVGPQLQAFFGSVESPLERRARATNGRRAGAGPAGHLRLPPAVRGRPSVLPSAALGQRLGCGRLRGVTVLPHDGHPTVCLLRLAA
jgi:hypothetical protein